MSDLPPEKGEKWSMMDYILCLSPHRMKAAVWKDFLWMWRNVPIMMFITLLPVVQMILFCLTIGRDPKYLHMAYVNDEMNFTTNCMPTNGCEYNLLSCRYLESLRLHKIVMVSVTGINNRNLIESAQQRTNHMNVNNL
ncbi:hypothetical protein ANN_13019 [Periplaneta americana]|uniref:Uncharacterized protein n=1 Tax=Periplaneta americana TaxID=6978 RepID=A0ABQ8TIR0_PERAM|nr:hypothetical protein ANN_13019 [Periplaneta americana]